MGYVDESFASHAWFALKFFIALLVLRVITLALGLTGYWPILDDVLAFLGHSFTEMIKLLQSIGNRLFPNLA